jgi:hypothetical protein
MTVDTKESMLQTWLAEQYSSEYEDDAAATTWLSAVS